MHRLEHRIPPPLIGLLIGVAMWLAAGNSEGMSVEPSLRTGVAAALVSAGIAFTLSGGFAFRRSKTTFNPLKPDTASSLVVGGIYRLSRNPMYVGFATVLLGWAAYLAAPATLAGPITFVAYITRFQIVPEERALTEKFGAEFAAYCARVRRWL